MTPLQRAVLIVRGLDQEGTEICFGTIKRKNGFLHLFQFLTANNLMR